MTLDEITRGVRALARSGLLTPRRPDRLARAFIGARHWGMTIAAAYTSGAARFEDRAALIDELGPVTYRTLDDRSNALAHGLRALGVEAGTVVGVMCRNHR